MSIKITVTLKEDNVAEAMKEAAVVYAKNNPEKIMKLVDITDSKATFVPDIGCGVDEYEHLNDVCSKLQEGMGLRFNPNDTLKRINGDIQLAVMRSNKVNRD